MFIYQNDLKQSSMHFAGTFLNRANILIADVGTRTKRLKTAEIELLLNTHDGVEKYSCVMASNARYATKSAEISMRTI